MTIKDVPLNSVYRTPDGNHYLRKTKDWSLWVGHDDNSRVLPLGPGTNSIVKTDDHSKVEIIGKLHTLGCK